MIPPSASFYAEWRAQELRPWLLREAVEPPPEHLLQLVWLHQRLLRDRLRTLDGRPVQVLHPGFRNREAGPDFRGAVLRLGEEPAIRGDVEVDLHSSGWRSHGHAGNPSFRQVALHVVWQGESTAALPTLPVRDALDAPLTELTLWLGGEQAAGFPEALRGQCCAPLRSLPDDRVDSLLCQASLVRLQGKAAWLQARARQAGWEQALWEGLFRALGYKHNIWPMQRLAELRRALAPAGASSEVLAWQARLLGVGCLLPEELARAQPHAGDFVRRLWDAWWRERDTFAEFILPRHVWHFAGLRPGNHPQRRLALAAHWLAAGDLPAKIERWGTRDLPRATLASSLLTILQVEQDPFWSRHWNLKAAPMSRPQPLLGEARATDLAVNAILPWLWSRAAEGRREALRGELERRYLAWPKAEDNSLLRLARLRLLGSGRGKLVGSAAAQQGLIQIVRDFCERSDSLCTSCRFPDLVRQWQSEETKAPSSPA